MRRLGACAAACLLSLFVFYSAMHAQTTDEPDLTKRPGSEAAQQRRGDLAGVVVGGKEIIRNRRRLAVFVVRARG